MITLEQVEKLREKTNVSFEDAKRALDACEGDMLDAVIWLERQGLLDAPASGGEYKTPRPLVQPTPQDGKKDSQRGENFRESCARLLKWCVKWIGKANNNFLEVRRKDELILELPVSVLVLLLVFLFWVTLPLIIAGLFLGCRYTFRGEELGREDVNRVMNKAADAAQNVTNEPKGEDGDNAK